MDAPEKKSRSLFVRIVFWTLPVLLVILIAGFFIIRSRLNAYLDSEAFRQLLGRLTSQQLKARCVYEPFHFSLTGIKAEAFKAEGTSKAAFSTLELAKINTVISLGALGNRVLQVDEVNIQRLRVSLGHTGAPPVPESEIGIVPEQETKPVATNSRFGWLSPKLDLRKIIVHDLNVIWGENTLQTGSVKGSVVTVKPGDGDAWNILLQSGTISQKGGPDMLLDHFNVTYKEPVVSITEGLLKFPPGGNIGINGEVNTSKHLDVQVKINEIPLKPFLPPDMQAKLKGKIFADIKVNAPMPVQGPPEVSGSGRLEGGDIEGIPALDFIAKFTRSPQYRKIKLNKAAADFKYAGQKVTVSNIAIESNGVVAVQGGFVINNANIDGTFQIGVPHDLVKWLPGLESKVFTAARGNYRWATMRLTGPLKSPHQDLQARIELALALSAVDLVEGVVKDVPKLPQAPKKVFDGLIKPLHK